VLDTNVVMDVYACTDLFREYEKTGGSGLNTKEAIFRRARTRESVVLGCHFHDVAATTWSLADESLEILQRLSPHSDGRDFYTHFTTWLIWFVKDYVLERWNWVTTMGAGAGLKGSECDDYLIKVCQESGIPLITNEGYSSSGTSEADSKKIRAKAIASGVKVYTPKQFWNGKINPSRATRRFLRRFDSNLWKFLKGRPATVRQTLQVIRGYYQHIFFGLVQNSTERVRVQL